MWSVDEKKQIFKMFHPCNPCCSVAVSEILDDYTAQNLRNLLNRWTIPTQKEIEETIALESHLGFVYDHPLGSGGLDPLQPGDNVVSITSPKLSQRENQGTIALESHLGFIYDHPLGSGGLVPLQLGDNEDLVNRNDNESKPSSMISLD